MDQATDSLARWRHNIYLIPQLIQNDVSSTKVNNNDSEICGPILTIWVTGSAVHSSGIVCAVLVANTGCRLHLAAWAVSGGRCADGQRQGARNCGRFDEGGSSVARLPGKCECDVSFKRAAQKVGLFCYPNAPIEILKVDQ